MARAGGWPRYDAPTSRPLPLRKDRETVSTTPARGAIEIALPDVEEMRALAADGRDKGFLTYDEIVGALQDADVSKEQVEDFYSHLLEVGVEVLDADGEVIASTASARTERRAELDLTVEPSLDSLRLYLREIGRVPLLTAGQEVALAKRIERGDLTAKAEMVEANLRLWCRSPRATWGAACRSWT